MPAAGRRDYDPDVDPAIVVLIEQKLTDSRHQLRAEFVRSLADVATKLTELSRTVIEGNIQSAREHAEVHIRLERVQQVVGDLTALSERVGTLETADAVDDGRDEERKEFMAALVATRRWAITTSVTVLIGGGAVILTHLH